MSFFKMVFTLPRPNVYGDNAWEKIVKYTGAYLFWIICVGMFAGLVLVACMWLYRLFSFKYEGFSDGVVMFALPAAFFGYQSMNFFGLVKTIKDVRKNGRGPIPFHFPWTLKIEQEERAFLTKQSSDRVMYIIYTGLFFVFAGLFVFYAIPQNLLTTISKADRRNMSLSVFFSNVHYIIRAIFVMLGIVAYFYLIYQAILLKMEFHEIKKEFDTRMETLNKKFPNLKSTSHTPEEDEEL